MKRILLAGFVLLAAACRKPQAPPESAAPAAAGERLIDFGEKNGAFACRAPAEWKAVEDDASGGPLVMFLGPTSGPRRGTASIGVSRYPTAGGRVKTPTEYVEMLKLTGAEPSALEARPDGTYALHYDSPQRAPRGRKVLYVNREDAVLVPAKDGFFLLSHTAPADGYQETMPVFQAVVDSFRPKG